MSKANPAANATDNKFVNFKDVQWGFWDATQL